MRQSRGWNVKNPPAWARYQGLSSNHNLFASAYQTAKPVAARTWNNPRFQGSLQATVGITEVGLGAAAAWFSAGFGSALGVAAMTHGLDQTIAGTRMAWTGRPQESATSQVLQRAGMSPNAAHLTDAGIGIALTLGAGATAQTARAAALHGVRVPTSRAFPVRNYRGWALPEHGGGAKINGRWYTEHALERMAPRTPRVMANLETRTLRRATAEGLEFRTDDFGRYWSKHRPDPRGVPPSVVEAEIAHPGSTCMTVELNEFGEVVTVYPGGR